VNLVLYTLRRSLYIIPVLLGVCLIIFLLFNVVAGDPTPMLLGKNATVSQMAELRHQLGLDRAWYYQYFDIVKSAFTFDFGRSWQSKQQIVEIIKQGAFPSLCIALPGFMISTIMSILIALVVAFYRGKGIDVFVRFLCIALVSISSLVYILFFQYVLAYKFSLFPIAGFEPTLPDLLYYIPLPIIIWVILSLGPDVRFFRTIILDEIYQDYVRTAKAKGLKEIDVLIKHVLRNALIPILTYVVIQIPFLVLGTVLLETFFAIPGLGNTVLNAVNNSDFPVLKAFTVLSSVAYIGFNLLTDVLYALVDPRVKFD